MYIERPHHRQGEARVRRMAALEELPDLLGVEIVCRAERLDGPVADLDQLAHEVGGFHPILRGSGPAQRTSRREYFRVEVKVEVS